MPQEASSIVQRLWNYCNVLRDDGLSYGDYVEQLTYLVFLKMADEWTRPPFNEKSDLPAGFDWDSLVHKDGDILEILTNKEVISIDQDPLGKQGYKFMHHQDKEIWVKELSDDNWAVCIFNKNEIFLI